MKKTVIATLITLTLGSTQAEYTIKIPLQGESIQFKTPNTELPPQPTEPSEPPVCSFSLDSPSAYWIVVGPLGSSSSEYGIYNDLDIGITPDENNKYPSVFIDTNSGIKYSRGAFVSAGGAGTDITAYEMCVSH